VLRHRGLLEQRLIDHNTFTNGFRIAGQGIWSNSSATNDFGAGPTAGRSQARRSSATAAAADPRADCYVLPRHRGLRTPANVT
jgi:hypothetical protein